MGADHKPGESEESQTPPRDAEGGDGAPTALAGPDILVVPGHENLGETGQTVERQAVKSFFWAATSTLGNRVATLVAMVFLARRLTPADFGVVASASFLLLLFEIGLDLGVGSALIYEQEQGVTSRAQTAFTLNIMVSFVLTAVAVALSPEIAAFFHVPNDTLLFAVLPLYLLIRGFGQVNDAILRRDMRFKERSVVDVARAMANVISAVGLAVAGYGVWALVLSTLLAEAVATTLNWVLVPFVPRFRIRRQDVRPLLHFGTGILGLKAMAEINQNADYPVVGRILGATQLGYYKMAFQIPELAIANTLWVFSSVAFPTYSKAREIGPDAMLTALVRGLRLLALFGFTVGAGLALESRDLVLVVFGAKWQPATAPMAVISVAMALNTIGYASGDIFNAKGRPGLLLKIQIPVTVAIVLCFAGAATAFQTILAVAFVHLTFACFYSGFRLVFASRLVGSNLRQNLAAIRPAAAATLGIVVCALPVRLLLSPGLRTLFAIAAAGTVGGAAGLFLGGREALPELRRMAGHLVAR